MNRLLIFITIICTYISSSYAQSPVFEANDIQGDFIVSEHLVDYDLKNIEAEYKIPETVFDLNGRVILPQIDKIIEVSVWGTTSEDGQVGDKASVDNKLAMLSSIFKPINLGFTACDFNTIPGYSFSKPSADPSCGNMNELISTNYTPLTLNLYIVETLSTDDERLAHMPDTLKNNDFIILTSESSDEDYIHAFSHFLGLYNTDERILFGAELADGSNCNAGGDLVCDTDADPGLKFKVDGMCEYTGFKESSNPLRQTPTDSKGMVYTPSMTNYMSAAPQSCMKMLTPMQQYRIVRIYNQFLTYLK